MTQHFLLSSKAKTLSLFDIASLSKEEAFRFVYFASADGEAMKLLPALSATVLISITSYLKNIVGLARSVNIVLV